MAKLSRAKRKAVREAEQPDTSALTTGSTRPIIPTDIPSKEPAMEDPQEPRPPETPHTGKFGIGPTAVILQQKSGFTYGALINQIWSVAGQSDRSAVSQMFIQPFFIYNWKSGAGIGMVGSITQNWETKTNTTTIAIPLTGITKFGKQIIQLAVAPQIPISGDPKPDFGWRAQLTLIFPK
jgi:hypothetical protein